MPRSVNSVASRNRRKKILKQAKGYFGRRKNVYTVAKNAVEKGMLYSYRDRKNNKRNLRSCTYFGFIDNARSNAYRCEDDDVLLFLLPLLPLLLLLLVGVDDTPNT